MNKLRLIQTCCACPEQYDAFFGDQLVGYFRLRHGFFRADYVAVPERPTVYKSGTIGDGQFEDQERHLHLNRASRAILERHGCLSDGALVRSG